MAYQSRGIQFPGGDYGASYIAGAGEAIGRGLSDLGGGIGKGIANNIGEREKSDALRSRFDLLAQEGYAPPELQEKFYKGSTGAQAGILTELMAKMDREAAAGQQRESARRFDLGYGLDAQRLNQQSEQFGQRMGFDRMQAGQDANYRNAQLQMQQQEQEAKRRPVEWSPLPGTDYIANDRGSVVPVRRQEEPGFVGDESGLGYYQDAQGNPVSPANILMQPPQPERSFFDFLPQKRQTAVPVSPRGDMPGMGAGAPEGTTLFPGDGTGSGLDLPSNPGPAGPSSLLQPLVPRAPAAGRAPQIHWVPDPADVTGARKLPYMLSGGELVPVKMKAPGQPVAPKAAEAPKAAPRRSR